MAHYLAELLLRAQKAKGKDRDIAEQECCALILKIWAHRTAIGSCPLESFRPILQTLERMGADSSQWYLPDDLKSKGEVGVWLKYALEVDSLAASLIKRCVSEAAVIASAKEKKWIKDKAVGVLGRGKDVALIFELVETVEDIRNPKIRRDVELKSFLKSIDDFSELADILRKRFTAKLTVNPPKPKMRPRLKNNK